MIIVKGFVEFPAFAVNTPGVVAPVGELSSISKTYSTEIGIHTTNLAPELNLRVFSIKDENNESVTASDHQIQQGMGVLAKIYELMLDANTSDANDLMLRLMSQFPSSFINPSSGNIISGAYDLPEWLSWSNADETVSFRVWFADAAFASQYDVSEIRTILPFDNIDLFFQQPSAVKQLIAGISQSDLIEKVNSTIGINPQTSIRTFTFEYINPNDSTDRVPVNFSAIIYGWASNNLDAIKEALVKSILEKSTRTREEWVQILPDLFRRTEFIIVPMVNRYAIDEMETKAGIYSPVVESRLIAKYINQDWMESSEAYVNQNVQVMALTHRSLLASVLGSPENIDGLNKITDHFPDYIAVGTMSSDFNRMSLKTQQWTNLLDSAVKAAELYSPNYSIPANLSRVRRNDNDFIAFNFYNVQYLVLTKQSLNASNLGNDSPGHVDVPM